VIHSVSASNVQPGEDQGHVRYDGPGDEVFRSREDNAGGRRRDICLGRMAEWSMALVFRTRTTLILANRADVMFNGLR
jgi:hypothetical protein